MKRHTAVGLLVGGSALLFTADHARAEQLREATGDCAATAQVQDGVFIDAYAPGSEVFEIPLAGSASYSGRVGNGEDRDIREFSGEIVIRTPPGLPDIELTDEWTWDGSGPGAAKTGTVDWDLPTLMPRGVPFRVEGFHSDNPEFCSGFVKVQIEGGLFDSVLGLLSVGGTVLTGAGVAFAGFFKGGAK